MRRGFHTLLTAMLLSLGGLAWALLAQGGAAAPDGQRAASTPVRAVNRADFNKTLVDHLKGRGFQVNPGYPMLWPADACENYLYPALNSCLGQNPASPYMIVAVKAWPHESLGPTPADAFGPIEPGYIPTYRLDPRDAIVIYGQMPPSAKYMSLQTYAWSQHGHWKAKDYDTWASTPNRPFPMQYLFETIPPNDPKAGRTFSFSDLGDPLNNVVMQEQSGDPFGKNRYFITTPSASTDRAVRRTLQAQGVPDGDIFTERIPSRDEYGAIGPLGMGENALDFWTTFKQAVPYDPVAFRRWWADPPLTVLRVRAPSSVGPVQRYGSVIYGEQKAQSEAYLADDLQNLVEAVCNRAGSLAGLHSADCTQPPPASSVIDWITSSGPYCRKTNMVCSNHTDGTGVVSPPFPLDSGQIYALVSTLATQTGNATYVGLAVNDASTFLTPTGDADTTVKGSADSYAPTVNHTDKFFVHYYTRKCADLGGLLDRGQDCTEINTNMVPAEGTTSALGDPTLRGKFMVILRDYIAPGTAHGPDRSKLLRPRILTFTKP